MYQNLLDVKLVRIDLEAKTKYEVLDVLSSLLNEEGYVKTSYIKAVKDRENTFPTGLNTNSVGVAIPHADSIHVLKPAIAIGVLKQPVKFNLMENENQEVDVKIIFMLAIKNSKMQLELLKSVVKIIQDESLLYKIVRSRSEKEVISLVESNI